MGMTTQNIGDVIGFKLREGDTITVSFKNRDSPVEAEIIESRNRQFVSEGDWREVLCETESGEEITLHAWITDVSDMYIQYDCYGVLLNGSNTDLGDITHIQIKK